MGTRDERVVDLLFVDQTSEGDPSEEGTVRLVNDDLVAYLDGQVKSLTSSSGLSDAQHKALRQLIHFIDDGPADGFPSGSYREVLPSGDPFPTSITWWESSSKLKKIVDLSVTRTGVLPTTEVWQVYDTDGSTVLATVSDSISYSGVFETDRTRTIT